MFIKNLLKKVGALCFIVFFIAGCVSQPSQQELTNADYGYSISQENAERLAKNWFNTKLKDPYSAQYNFTQVERAYLVTPIIYGGTKYFGYRVIANVNAKNSYGGYGGYKEYIFMFKHGKIEIVMGPPEGEYRLRQIYK